MLSPFDTYKEYLAYKNHFTKEKYDYQRYGGKSRAKIDSFLMSCRVIGRNIEFVFVDYIISQLKKNKIEIIDATYSPTKKNQQVAKFYKENYFKLLSEVSSNINYRLDINNFIKTKIDYIGIENG